MTHQRKRTLRLIGANQERCIYCAGARITKKGRRKKQHETIQLWYCRDCECVFTPQRTKGMTYPVRVIIAALSHYYRGHPAEATCRHIKERYGIALPERTLRDWLTTYKDLTPYARLRKRGMQHYTPHQIIKSARLYHRQVYTYLVHQAKLDFLMGTDRRHKQFTRELPPRHAYRLSARSVSGQHACFRP